MRACLAEKCRLTQNCRLGRSDHRWLVCCDRSHPAIAGAVRKAMQEKGLLLDSEYSVTRLQRLNLTDSQQGDVITYEPWQIVEFHRMAKGVVRNESRNSGFKSGEQWEVLRWEEGAVIAGKKGVEKQLLLDQTRKFSMFEREKIKLSKV
jgi:hypothetical protein